LISGLYIRCRYQIRKPVGGHVTYMTGTITLSLEIELGWGLAQFNKLDTLSDDRRQETDHLRRLLTLCDELSVPITFDIVGHLLLFD
jgi:hypothetical protein